jgi:hypothetical protein
MCHSPAPRVRGAGKQPQEPGLSEVERAEGLEDGPTLVADSSPITSQAIRKLPGCVTIGFLASSTLDFELITRIIASTLELRHSLCA